MKPLTIAIAQSKGGVAKTTTAWALGSILSKKYKVLLIDMDAQRTLTTAVATEHTATSYDVLTGKNKLADSIVPAIKSYGQNLSIIPASNLLTGLDSESASRFDRQYLLVDTLKDYDDADVIIIDCPSSQGILTVCSLTAADYVLSPVPTAPTTYSQVSKFQKTVELVSGRMNPSLKQLPLLACMYDRRNSLDNEVLSELRKQYELFETVIPKRVKISEEMAAQVPCSNEDYRQFAKELMRRIKS